MEENDSSEFTEDVDVEETSNLNDCPTSLPEKSKEKYLAAYNNFLTWKTNKGMGSVLDESVVLAYMQEMSQTLKPTTLWGMFTMLRSTIFIHEKVDVYQFKEVAEYLKKISKGYKAKQLKVFSEDQIARFLEEAPDNKYLCIKVMLIMGQCGSCTSRELYSLKLSDIEDKGGVLLIKVPSTGGKKPRTFAVSGDFYNIYKKYSNLRPPNCGHDKVFISYFNGSCRMQVIGCNKLGCAPRQIAKWLGLKDIESYGGHCFYKSTPTSAFAYADVEDYARVSRYIKERSSAGKNNEMRMHVGSNNVRVLRKMKFVLKIQLL